MFELLNAGGPVMWAFPVLSVIAVAIIIDRSLYFHQMEARDEKEEITKKYISILILMQVGSLDYSSCTHHRFSLSAFQFFTAFTRIFQGNCIILGEGYAHSFSAEVSMTAMFFGFIENQLVQ